MNDIAVTVRGCVTIGNVKLKCRALDWSLRRNVVKRLIRKRNKLEAEPGARDIKSN